MIYFFLVIVSFKHTATPILFMDDPGELALDEESYSAMNTGSGGILTNNREQVGELSQVVS